MSFCGPLKVVFIEIFLVHTVFRAFRLRSVLRIFYEVNQVPTNSQFAKLRRFPIRFFFLAMAVLATVPLVGMTPSQSPPGNEIVLVNDHRDLVERMEDGGFIARPVYNRRIDNLFYGVRDTDDGEWLTPVYVVLGGEKQVSRGWEYSWEYSSLGGEADLDPERPYLLVMVADVADGNTQAFHALIPVYQSMSLWDRVLRAFSPETWARAVATWVVEGVHGTLCGVLERATGDDIGQCREGS